MKIFVGLVTPNAALRGYFGIRKEGIVPQGTLSTEFYRRKNPAITTNSYEPQGLPSIDGFEQFLLARIPNFDACILLIDREWEYLTTNIRNAALTAVFDGPANTSNPQNFFHGMIGNLFKAYMRLATYFDDFQTYQLLCLPIRNFFANELSEMVSLCHDGCVGSTFHNILQDKVAILNRRRRPRRRSETKMNYIVDDKERFFVLGKEMHAQFATGHPHEASCIINALFRFGNRVDERRHYNVSETEGDKTSISGQFFNCHGLSQRVSKTTHLNMFCNDFF